MESGSDFNCDFNAPMFVDFTALDNENDHADAEAYFEVSKSTNWMICPTWWLPRINRYLYVNFPQVNHEFGENNGAEIPTDVEDAPSLKAPTDPKEEEQPKVSAV